MPAPRQEQRDAIPVPGQPGDVELGQFGGPQRRRETDEQQGAVVQPGQGVGIARKAARNDSTTSAVFLRSGRRWSRRIPAKVAATSGEAVGGG